MDNKAILTKAIQKALDHGWKPHTPTSYLYGETNATEIARYFDEEEYEYAPLEWLIFNKEFAKALWGESLIHDIIERNYSRDIPMYADDLFLPVNNWQYHLQQMVIAEDPIKYLGEHLDD